jgi:hypothetical protein
MRSFESEPDSAQQPKDPFEKIIDSQELPILEIIRLAESHSNSDGPED